MSLSSLHFHYAKANNFICFGPEGIELFFDQFQNIVLVKGENLDVKPMDEEDCDTSSNGSGKSSVFSLITYALYGKTISKASKIGKSGVVHNLIGKDCYTEVIFNDCRIVRTREPDSLRFWRSSTHTWDKNSELTQGVHETQKAIDKEIKLTYEAFVNIVVFSDDNNSCFLECDAKTKREIVENLLSLSKYRDWHDKTKEMLKELKDKIKLMSHDYEILLNRKKDAESRMQQVRNKEIQWQQNRTNEIAHLKQEISKLEQRLKTTDVGKELLVYRDAQEQIKEINTKIPIIEKEAANIETALNELDKKSDLVKQKVQTISEDASRQNSLIREQEKIITDKQSHIKSLERKQSGSQCSTCYGVVEEGNILRVINDDRQEVETATSSLIELNKKAEDLIKNANEIKGMQQKIKDFKLRKQNELNDIKKNLQALRQQFLTYSQVKEPKADTNLLVFEQKIKNIQEQIAKKEQESSPFIEIIASAENEVNNLGTDVETQKQTIKDNEDEVPYIEYWCKAFGDKGIRKWVIDGIIPILNERVNYWLQFLIDNKIQLNFNNQLEETIERNPPDGDPYIYHAMSQGQRRRLNLAVSQAFAHIMTISSGVSPSLIFLDEISTNIDKNGQICLHRVICELAEGKKVFITTHSQDLVEMLQGAETLVLRHQYGFTTLANSEKN